MKSLRLTFAFVVLVSCDVVTVDQTAFYNDFVKIDFGVESGYVSQPLPATGADSGTGNTFYQLTFKAGQDYASLTATDPLIIWLNGGPGCASQFGLYGEIGPFVVSNGTAADTFTIALREYSWNKQAHLLFVDQPFGAGFSYTSTGSIVTNTEASAVFFAEFLAQFYTQYPKLKSNALYLFGESFAGHYIPAIGVKILASEKLKDVMFTGVGIGDGWTSPINQVSTYASYLYAAGLVDDLRKNTAQNLATQAQASILQNDYLKASKYFDQVSGDLLSSYTGNVSPYNFQTYVTDSTKVDPYAAFLNLNKDKFGATKTTYQGCNSDIYAKFTDICESREADLVAHLVAGKRVLLYNGQLDYIVNTPGALLWINQMKWDQIDEWKKQEKTFFKVSGVVQGWVKQYKNFVFTNIYQSGHMVPSDQPVAASNMLIHYLKQDAVWE